MTPKIDSTQSNFSTRKTRLESYTNPTNKFRTLHEVLNKRYKRVARVRLAQSPARQSGTSKGPYTPRAGQPRSTRPCSPSRTSPIGRIQRRLHEQRANFRLPNYRVWETQTRLWKVGWIKRKLYSIVMKASNSSMPTLSTWARSSITWYQTGLKRASNRACVPIRVMTRQRSIWNL